jgi:hypothetical protein
MKITPPPTTAVALTIAAVTARYGISRTRVFAEIKAGRLEARKAGRATLVAVESADAWYQDLPAWCARIPKAS